MFFTSLDSLIINAAIDRICLRKQLSFSIFFTLSTISCVYLDYRHCESNFLLQMVQTDNKERENKKKRKPGLLTKEKYCSLFNRNKCLGDLDRQKWIQTNNCKVDVKTKKITSSGEEKSTNKREEKIKLKINKNEKENTGSLMLFAVSPQGKSKKTEGETLRRTKVKFINNEQAFGFMLLPRFFFSMPLRASYFLEFLLFPTVVWPRQGSPQRCHCNN